MDKETKDRLRYLATMLKDGRGFCAQCGVVSYDEDGCCVRCGATASGAAMDALAADLSAL